MTIGSTMDTSETWNGLKIPTKRSCRNCKYNCYGLYAPRYMNPIVENGNQCYTGSEGSFRFWEWEGLDW